MFFSPFEQFEINVFLPLVTFIDLSVTNLVIYTVFSFVIISGLFALITKDIKLIPTPFQSLVEKLYIFIRSLLLAQTGPKGIKYSSIIFYFLFILMLIY